MKVGGQIVWNVTPICETSQIYCLSCETPAAPPDRAAGARTRQPENSKRAHLSVPALQNTTKIPREDPQRGKKRTNFVAGEGKKARNVGPPTLRGSTFRGSTLLGSTLLGSTLRAPTFTGFGPPPFGPPPFGPPTLRAPHPSGLHPSGLHPSGPHPSGPPPFGAPTLRGPHPSGPPPFGAPTLRGPTFSRFGPPPIGAPPFRARRVEPRWVKH